MKQQGIQSLEIGLKLFQELHRLSRQASLSELAKLTGMPPAKVHRYCVSLIRTGLMQQDGRGRYGIGPLGFQLSHPRANLEHARTLAAEALPELVQRTGETAFICEWGQVGPRIFRVEDPPKPISIRPTSKGDLPLLNSATGRVFSAYMSPARLEPIVAAALEAKKRDERLSVAAVASQRAVFNKHLADVRRRGIARTTGERYPGLVSFSAPIFDAQGDVILALTSFGFGTTLPSSWNGPVPAALKKAAHTLTERIGGAAPR